MEGELDPDGVVLASSAAHERATLEPLFLHKRAQFLPAAFATLFLVVFPILIVVVSLTGSSGADPALIAVLVVLAGIGLGLAVRALMGLKVTVFSDRIVVRNSISAHTTRREAIRSSFTPGDSDGIFFDVVIDGRAQRRRIEIGELTPLQQGRLLDRLNEWLAATAAPTDAEPVDVRDAAKPTVQGDAD